MKKIILLCIAGSLSACSAMRSNDPNSMYFDIPDGSTLSLNKELTIPANETHAVVQQGKEVKDILIKINAFITALKGDQLDSTNLNDQLRIFSGVKEYPARKKCVSLPWEELRDYLVKSSYI